MFDGFLNTITGIKTRSLGFSARKIWRVRTAMGMFGENGNRLFDNIVKHWAERDRRVQQIVNFWHADRKADV